MNDPLAVNKILASFLCACLLLIGAGKFASFMQGSNEHHDDHHQTTTNAYPILVPETGIESGTSLPNDPVPILSILALLSNADLNSGKKISKKCAACHSFNSGGPNKVGPNLWNILNRSMGSKEDYKYSKALKTMDGVWDYSSLNKFLLKPKDYISGTKMNYTGLKKEQDRANIIVWLRSLSDNPEPLPSKKEIKLESGSNS